jgi:hypothetical protein
VDARGGTKNYASHHRGGASAGCHVWASEIVRRPALAKLFYEETGLRAEKLPRGFGQTQLWIVSNEEIQDLDKGYSAEDMGVSESRWRDLQPLRVGRSHARALEEFGGREALTQAIAEENETIKDTLLGGNDYITYREIAKGVRNWEVSAKARAKEAWDAGDITLDEFQRISGYYSAEAVALRAWLNRAEVEAYKEVFPAADVSTREAAVKVFDDVTESAVRAYLKSLGKVDPPNPAEAALGVALMPAAAAHRLLTEGNTFSGQLRSVARSYDRPLAKDDLTPAAIQRLMARPEISKRLAEEGTISLDLYYEAVGEEAARMRAGP